MASPVASLERACRVPARPAQASTLSSTAVESAQSRLRTLELPGSLHARLGALGRPAEAGPAADEGELAAFGITADFREFIRSLTYATFRDFPQDALPAGAEARAPPSLTLQLSVATLATSRLWSAPTWAARAAPGPPASAGCRARPPARPRPAALPPVSGPAPDSCLRGLASEACRPGFGVESWLARPGRCSCVRGAWTACAAAQGPSTPGGTRKVLTPWQARGLPRRSAASRAAAEAAIGTRRPVVPG